MVHVKNISLENSYKSIIKPDKTKKFSHIIGPLNFYQQIEIHMDICLCVATSVQSSTELESQVDNLSFSIKDSFFLISKLDTDLY